MNLRNWSVFFVAGLLLVGCGEKEPAKEAGEEKAPETESHVKRGTNGEVIVTVDSKTQPTIGLQTAILRAAQMSPQLKAYGHVLDSSSLASIVADLVTAEAAGQASQAELNRLNTLASQNNTSQRAVQ